MAARNADAGALKRELADGAAINSRNRLGETVLVIALEEGPRDLASRCSTPAPTSTWRPSTA